MREIQLGLITDDATAIGIAQRTDEYLRGKPRVLAEIAFSGRVLHHLVELVPITPSNAFSGDVFPLFEAYYEFESALALARFGYYKHARMATANLLELGILSASDVGGRSHIDVRKLEPLQDIPNWRRYLERAPGFPDEVAALHDALVGYVHTRDTPGSLGTSSGLSNASTFDEGVFIAWLGQLRSAVSSTVILHLLRYPAGIQGSDDDPEVGPRELAGNVLQRWKSDELLKYIPEDARGLVREIAAEE
jgi:hypothetical protein